MHRPMLELEPRATPNLPLVPQDRQVRIKRHATQAHHHPHVLEQAQLALKKRPAPRELHRHRLIVWRSAPNRRRNPAVAQFQPIVLGNGLCLRSEPGLMQRPIQPLPRLVTGKQPPRPIRPMRPRRKANDQQPRLRIPERRHRTRPVLLIPIRPALDLPNLDTMPTQPLALLASHHIGFENAQTIRPFGQWQPPRSRPSHPAAAAPLPPSNAPAEPRRNASHTPR